MAPRLDIVIVNWNAGPLLEGCIASVLASDCQGFALDRVVVVDNGSTDGSTAFLATAEPPLVLIENQANRGFAAACNGGAAGSAADYLLFLNPDTVLDRDTLSRAVTFMEAPENAGVDISGIRLRDEQGRTQRCCSRYPTPWLMVAHSLGLDRVLPRLVPSHFLTEWDHEDTRDVPQVMGAFLLIRRSAFERLGGFDERFFVYYEDVDLCFRAVQAGGRCVHNAAVSAVHVGGGTTDRIKARRQFYGARSRIQYAAKHFGPAGAVLAGLAGLVFEPLARMAQGAARGSRQQIADAAEGARLLWQALPEMLSGGVPPHPAAKAAAPLPQGARGPSLRVLALTRYPRQGASSRLRFLAYLDTLAAEGFEVTVSPFFDEGYLPALYGGRRPDPLAIGLAYLRRIKALLGCRAYDLVWIEKEALPWLPLSVEQWLLQGVATAIDFDDAWYLRYEASGSPLVRRLLGGKLSGLVATARVILAGNGTLAHWARTAGAPTVVELPTAVDLDRYGGGQKDAGTEAGATVIGWMGTPSSARDCLRPLAPVLSEIVAAGWARLTVVGADGVALTVPATRLAWREDDEARQLRDFDIGIMPLVDDAWSRGKCAYKLIQYMAAGLPVVASPVGMNAEVVRPGENGFLATTPEEWTTALKSLAADATLRHALGEAGRQLVEARYSTAAIAPRLVAALRQAAASPISNLAEPVSLS